VKKEWSHARRHPKEASRLRVFVLDVGLAGGARGGGEVEEGSGMKSKFRNQRIKIATKEGFIETGARILGDLAVIYFPKDDPSTLDVKYVWQVIHIPTGKVARDNLCCYRSAKALTEKLQVFNWGFMMTPAGRFPENVKEQMNEAGKIVKGWTCPAKRKKA
jgi:hypothetical protein